MYYEFSLFPYKVSNKPRKNMKDRVDWSLKTLSIGNVWHETKGKGIKVAILDTGYATNHPDLQKAVLEFKDFTGDGIYDGNGHGTHVAGLVGARENNVGIVGIAPKCKLLIAKVLSNSGGGKSKWIADGIKWAADQGADIISMSLGSQSSMTDVRSALKSLTDKTMLVAAAGNSGPKLGTVGYPAKYSIVISVGAISKDKKVTSWSSRGRTVDVVAPGDNITSSYPPRGIASLSGTSMACPIVAGVMALALAKHRINGGSTPINNRKDMLDHLIKSSIDMGKKGKDSNYGFGLIDPKRLLAG